MTKKQQLYYLIEEFVKGNYSVKSFCQAYENTFYPDFPKKELTSEELSKFEFLGSIVSRFSPFDEDVKLYPNTYFTEEYVKEAIFNVYFELLHQRKNDE